MDRDEVVFQSSPVANEYRFEDFEPDEQEESENIDDYLEEFNSRLMNILQFLQEDKQGELINLFQDQHNFYRGLLDTCTTELNIRQEELDELRRHQDGVAVVEKIELEHMDSGFVLFDDVIQTYIESCIKKIIIEETFTSHPRQFKYVRDLIINLINTGAKIEKITLITRPDEEILKFSSLLEIKENGKKVMLDMRNVEGIRVNREDGVKIIGVDEVHYILLKNKININQLKLDNTQLSEIVLIADPGQNSETIKITEKDSFFFKDNVHPPIQISNVQYFVLRHNSNNDASSIQVTKLNHLVALCRESNIKFKCATYPEHHDRVITIKRQRDIIDIHSGRGLDIYINWDQEKLYRDQLLYESTIIVLQDFDVNRPKRPRKIVYLPTNEDKTFVTQE